MNCNRFWALGATWNLVSMVFSRPSFTSQDQHIAAQAREC
jgi:hypothetical protein